MATSKTTSAKSTAKKAAPAKTAKKTATAKKAAKPVDRAAAIAKSWKDPAIAAARSTHTKVKVGGEVYRSVPSAFVALGLPLGRMGPFRLAVKGAGRAVFDNDGTKYTFTTVAA